MVLFCSFSVFFSVVECSPSCPTLSPCCLGSFLWLHLGKTHSPHVMPECSSETLEHSGYHAFSLFGVDTQRISLWGPDIFVCYGIEIGLWTLLHFPLYSCSTVSWVWSTLKVEAGTAAKCSRGNDTVSSEGLSFWVPS